MPPAAKLARARQTPSRLIRVIPVCGALLLPDQQLPPLPGLWSWVARMIPVGLPAVDRCRLEARRTGLGGSLAVRAENRTIEVMSPIRALMEVGRPGVDSWGNSSSMANRRAFACQGKSLVPPPQ